MTTAAKASAPPSSPKTPSAETGRRSTKVRLILVDGKALPAGVVSVLERSAIECVFADTYTSLGGVNLRRTDVVVLPNSECLDSVAAILEPSADIVEPADKPSIVIIEPSSAQPRLNCAKLDLIWLQPVGKASAIARQLVQSAGQALLDKGVVRRKPRADPSAAATVLDAEPKRSPLASSSVRALVPSSLPADRAVDASTRSILDSPEQAEKSRRSVTPKKTLSSASKLALDAPTKLRLPVARPSAHNSVQPPVALAPSSPLDRDQPSGNRESTAAGIPSMPVAKDRKRARGSSSSGTKVEPKPVLGLNASVDREPSLVPAAALSGGTRGAASPAAALISGARASVSPAAALLSGTRASVSPAAALLSGTRASVSPASPAAPGLPASPAAALTSGTCPPVPVAPVPAIVPVEPLGLGQLTRLPAATISGIGQDMGLTGASNAVPPQISAPLAVPTSPAPVIRSLMPASLDIEGSRWLLLDDDVARAHAVAKALESAGARVLLSGLSPSAARVSLLRNFDASGVLIEESSLNTAGTLLQRFEQDPRLRWVNLVPIRWHQIHDAKTARVDFEALKLRVLPHWQPEHDLLEAFAVGQSVDLDRLGPAKLLRCAARLGACVDVKVEGHNGRFVVRINDGAVIGLWLNGQECWRDNGAAIQDILNLSHGMAELVTAQPGVSGGDRPIDLEALLEAAAVSRIEVEPSPPQLRSPAVWISMLRAKGQQLSTALSHRWQQTLVVWAKLDRRHRQVLIGGAGMACLGLVLAASLASGREQQGHASTDESLESNDFAEARVVTRAGQAPGEQVGQSKSAPGVEQTSSRSPTAASNGNSEKQPASDYRQSCRRWTAAQAAEPQPQQAKSAWLSAMKAIQAGEQSKAEELLCFSVAMDSSGPGAIGLVRYYLSQSNVDTAAGWAEWALQQQPDSRDLKQALADVRSQQGRADEARALLHDAMDVSAADQQVLKQVARKYANTGYKALRALDPNQAERLFWRAKVLDGKNALASAGLSEIALHKGQPKAALEHAKVAVEVDPRCFEAQLSLGDARAENNQPDLAKQAWLEAAKLRPRSREPRKRLGL